MEEKERKKKEQAEEIQRAEEKTKNALHEQLKEQEKFEAVSYTHLTLPTIYSV